MSESITTNPADTTTNNEVAFASALADAVGSVPYGYESKLKAASDAAVAKHEELLAEHDYDLFDKLFNAANDRGYGYQARAILEAVGLTERPAPEPEPEPEVEVPAVTDQADDASDSDDTPAEGGAPKSGKGARIASLEAGQRRTEEALASLVASVDRLTRVAQDRGLL